MSSLIHRPAPWFFAILVALLTAASHGQTIVSDCTQEALEEAIGDESSTDTWVTFECDGSIFLTNTISLLSSEAAPTNIVREVILDGTGRSVTINGLAFSGSTNAVRLFHIGSGVSLVVTNIKFVNGRSTNGGALFLETNAAFTAYSCLFSNNLAQSSNGLNGASYAGRDSTGTGRSGGSGAPAAPAAGGAIYSLGDVWLGHCVFLTNGVIGGDGGIGGGGGNGSTRPGNGGNGGRGGPATGGAIYNRGTLTTSNAAFYLNFAIGGSGGTGGAIGSGLLGGTSGQGGTAGGASGGAIFNGPPGRATSIKTTFAANVAVGGDSEAGGSNSGSGKRGGSGGQSSGGAVANFSTNSLINCTFFANTVTGGQGGDGSAGSTRGGTGGGGGSAWGGGIFNGGSFKRGKSDITVIHCTIADGEATGGTNGLAGGGPLPGRNGKAGLSRGANIANSNGVFRITNSIIAYATVGTNAYGKKFTGVNNIISDLSLKSFKTAFTNVDPRLETLQSNGGHVQTMELLEESPAIDFAHAITDLTTDARGISRAIGERADAGAYEYGVFLGPPRITTHPAGRKVREDGSVLFTVVAQGDDPLRYQWKKDGEDIDGETTTTLELFDLTDDDAADYTVVVSNNSGSVTSDAATLTIAKPPTITEDIGDITVAKGESFTLSVTAEGDAPLRYEWYRDGTNVPGAVLPTFFVSNISTTTTYQVVVRNEYGDTPSTLATVTVTVQRPGITAQPVSQTIAVSNSVTFSVDTTGSRPQTYQWYFNETNLITGATNHTYRIAPARATNEGLYSVIISNEAGSTNSTNATLVVVTNRPAIITQPVGTNVIAGGTANFAVTALSAGPIRYQWYFNTNTAVAGATNSSLSITNVQATNQGQYRVVISNLVGNSTSVVAVLTVVTSAPVIITQPVDLQVPAGTPITLTVGAIGSPPLAYQWYQTPIDSFGNPTSGPVALTGGTNAILTLPVPESGSEARWEGLYYVIITNTLGTVTSVETTLNVEGFGVPP